MDDLLELIFELLLPAVLPDPSAAKSKKAKIISLIIVIFTSLMCVAFMIAVYSLFIDSSSEDDIVKTPFVIMISVSGAYFVLLIVLKIISYIKKRKNAIAEKEMPPTPELYKQSDLSENEIQILKYNVICYIPFIISMLFCFMVEIVSLITGRDQSFYNGMIGALSAGAFVLAVAVVIFRNLSFKRYELIEHKGIISKNRVIFDIVFGSVGMTISLALVFLPPIFDQSFNNEDVVVVIPMFPIFLIVFFILPSALTGERILKRLGIKDKLKKKNKK